MRALRAAFAFLPALELKTGSSRFAVALSSAGKHASSSLYSSSSVSSNSNLNPITGNQGVLNQQRQILLQRGQLEAKLMSSNPTEPLEFHAPCPAMDDTLEFSSTRASTLSTKGVLGLEKVLPTTEESENAASKFSTTTCKELRDYILDFRTQSQEAIAQQEIARSDRFAKCLLSDHRDDLLLPLTSTSDTTKQTSNIVHRALNHILQEGNVGAILELMVGSDATIFELAALISDPGSDRQNVHPDHACVAIDTQHTSKQQEPPLVITCFVALQDIEPEMGPTIWLPGTHTPEIHAQFQRRRVEDVFAAESPKDTLLRSSPVVAGAPMPAGACALFDSRVLHAGTANTSSKQSTRVVFYFSFKRKNADVGVEKGSLGYGLDEASLTVSDLLL